MSLRRHIAHHVLLGIGIVGGFTACSGSDTLKPSTAASVVASEGGGQTGLAGFPLNVRPAVLVRDVSHQPVANVEVSFAVTSGGGSVTGGLATTDSNGIATVGTWKVQAGANTLQATVSGTGISGNPVTFTATGAMHAFTIDVRFLTGVTPLQREAFDSAKAKWERLVYGDLPDESVTGIPAGACGPGTPPVNETIDDVVIFAALDSIDGPGDSTILAGAGPCLFRNGFLPLAGAMLFDTADVARLIASGQFAGVIEHEMGHVLGFGTIWQPKGLLAGPVSQGGVDPHFVGSQAIAAFNENGGATYGAGQKVPVENCLAPPPGVVCGLGSYDGHWRETILGDELMTFYQNVGVVNPLSVITAAAMADLGYQVNFAASDPYSVAGPDAFALPGAVVRSPLHERILRFPTAAIASNRRVKRAN